MAPRTILSVLVPQAQNPLSLSGTGSRERQQQFLSGSAIHNIYIYIYIHTQIPRTVASGFRVIVCPYLGMIVL